MLVPLSESPNVALSEGWWSSWEGLYHASQKYFTFDYPDVRILETIDGKYHIVEKLDPVTERQVQWVTVALKIVSYMTVIIPLIVFVISIVLIHSKKTGERDFYFYREPDVQNSSAFFEQSGLAGPEGLTPFLLALYPHLPPCSDKLHRLADVIFRHSGRVNLNEKPTNERDIDLLCKLDPNVLFEVSDSCACALFSTICFFGHLNVIKHLTQKWDFSDFEQRFVWEEGFGYACWTGQADVVRYLYEKHPVKLSPLQKTGIYAMITDYEGTNVVAEKRRFEELFTYFCETEPLKTELCQFLIDEMAWKLNGAFGDFMRSHGMSFNLLGRASRPTGRENLDDEELRRLYDIILGSGSPTPTTKLEWRRAYRKMALKLHPDRHGGNDAPFKELGRAWAELQETRVYEDLPD